MFVVLLAVYEVGDYIRNVHNLRGHVTKVNEDGTYDVEYRDKQWDKNMTESQLCRGAHSS